MNRHIIILNSESDRIEAMKIITNSKPGLRLEFKESKRSNAQNNRMWPALNAISRQFLWHGAHWEDHEWKDYFMHAYRGEKWMPYEDGGMISVGRSTSDLSKAEHSKLMSLIEAFCARHDVALPWDREAQ